MAATPVRTTRQSVTTPAPAGVTRGTAVTSGPTSVTRETGTSQYPPDIQEYLASRGNLIQGDRPVPAPAPTGTVASQRAAQTAAAPPPSSYERNSLVFDKLDEWKAYDESQKAREAFDALPWWQKIGRQAPDGGSAPVGDRPPRRSDYATNAEYQAASADWYRRTKDQEWINQSAFREDAWDSRLGPLASAAGNDLLNARQTQDRKTRDAWALANEIDQERGTGSTSDLANREMIQDAFGGDYQAYLDQIGQGKDTAIEAANVAYKDVLTRFDDLAKQRKQALASLKSDEKEALEGFANDTARMVDSFRVSLSGSLAQENQKIAEYAQQTGRSMDDPAIQAMTFQLRQSTLSQVGDVANKSWSAFNDRRLTSRETFANIRASLSGTFAQAHTYGLQSVAEAGRTYSMTISDTQKWAAQAKNDAAQIYTNASLEADKLALAGDQLSANAVQYAVEQDQWVPEFGLVASLFGAQNSLQQQDFAKTMTVVSTILGAIPGLAQTFFPGRYMPSTPSDNSWIGDLGGSAISGASLLGGAAILR